MLRRKSFQLHRALLLLPVWSLAACSGDTGPSDAADTALANEKGPPVASTTQALDDPDGLLTPDFGSPFLPPEIKELADLADKASGYYSKAKSTYDVITWGLKALGFMEPDDPDRQFKKLEDALTKLVTADDVHDTMYFIDANRGPMNWAWGRIPLAGGRLEEGQNEDQSSGEAAETITLPDDAAFYRVDNPKATDGVWKRIITDRPEPLDGIKAGLVYDWRLGAPALLEIIAKRLAVIAAMHPDFRWDHRYDTQLRNYRAAIQRNLDKMRDGIRCSSRTSTVPLGLGQACADIYTGVYAWEPFSQWTRFPSAAEDEQIMQLLKSHVIHSMPIFEMQRMIDTLTLYINDEQDLTEVNSEIRLSQAQDLCLDVQWGNSGTGTPIWMWPCNAGGAQWWSYDRSSGQIRNGAFGVCVDVLPKETWFPGQTVQPTPGIKAGSGVVTSMCNDSGSQKWTWNPDSETLQNEYGMVLNASSPDAQAMVNVAAGPPAGSAGQRWLSVQKVIGKRTGLLWRYPSGELHVWDMLSPYRYENVLIGAAGLEWQVIATGDFNGDGHSDILWRNWNLLSVWNLKSTTLTDGTPATANSPAGTPLVGDLDGDGVSDLAWNALPNPTLTWLMNPGSTTPRLETQFQSTVNRVVALGNFDGDSGNVADQIRMPGDATVDIALSTGSSYRFTVGTTEWVIAGIGDFNADGTSDILWFHTGTSDVAISPVSAGQPLPGAIIGTVPPSSGWYIVGVADIDNDGISDIIWRHLDGPIGFWMMSDPTTVREYPSLWMSPEVDFAGSIRLGPPKG